MEGTQRTRLNQICVAMCIWHFRAQVDEWSCEKHDEVDTTQDRWQWCDKEFITLFLLPQVEFWKHWLQHGISTNAYVSRKREYTLFDLHFFINVGYFHKNYPC